MKRLITLLLAALTLSSCGMTSAIGVLPNTLNDLAEHSERLRGETAEENAAPAEQE